MPASDKKAIVFALLAVFCWSTVATAFKLALQQQSIYQLLMIANGVSLVTFAIALLSQKKLKQAVTHWPAMPTTLMLAVLNPVVYYVLLFAAYNQLPAQVAQPINYTWALSLTVLSVPLLGHRVTRRDSLALFLGYSGVVVVSFAGAASGLDVTGLGVLLAFLSTVIWALYWLLSARDSREPLIALFQNFLIALPLSFVVFMVFDGEVRLQTSALFTAIYIGIFEMGVAFIFWLLALKTVSRVSIISNLIFISPFISLFFIHKVLEETVSLGTLFGLVVLMAGLLLQRAQKVQAN
ncbi:EamA-like transporter family protein [Alteromonadaceae bacterium 2753L.S.0a.02]|nr:EamA-like transporter family protein [Alteromonadaceae bacterium 2753L.S.0a.02]